MKQADVAKVSKVPRVNGGCCHLGLDDICVRVRLDERDSVETSLRLISILASEQK